LHDAIEGNLGADDQFPHLTGSRLRVHLGVE
jgi:hypothetical protein